MIQVAFPSIAYHEKFSSVGFKQAPDSGVIRMRCHGKLKWCRREGREIGHIWIGEIIPALRED